MSSRSRLVAPSTVLVVALLELAACGGKGIPRKDTRGDLYAILDVRMPDKVDDALAAALKASADAYSAPVRQELVP